MKAKKYVLTGIVFCLFSILSASAAFDSGYDLFVANQPAEAIPYFTTALSESDVPASIYIYLGIAYYQTGRYADALKIFEKGLSASGTDKRVLAFNAGNTAFVMGNYLKAEELYSLACAADPLYAAPVLNRANTRVALNKLEVALTDYNLYLSIVPEATQKDAIEQMITKINTELEFKVQETARLKAEEERLAKEVQRLAEEKAMKEAQLATERAAEAERRRKLLEEVASSLQETSTTNMNAGTEGVIDYEYESELD